MAWPAGFTPGRCYFLVVLSGVAGEGSAVTHSCCVKGPRRSVSFGYTEKKNRPVRARNAATGDLLSGTCVPVMGTAVPEGSKRKVARCRMKPT